jgi:hypothetical protein
MTVNLAFLQNGKMLPVYNTGTDAKMDAILAPK